MRRTADTYSRDKPATAPRQGGNLASLKRIVLTGNIRAACAMVFAGVACMWTCAIQRAAGTQGLRRRQVLLLTYQGPRR